MVIRFGITEKEFETRVEREIRERVHNEFREQDFFDEDFVSEIKRRVFAHADRTRAEAERYDAADSPPARYSYYRATVLYDASHIVFILRFMHINRKHAMSADVWACMPTERVFFVYGPDIKLD